jgi:C4-dicarboxylate-specific signal transduction histidine kinase
MLQQVAHQRTDSHNVHRMKDLSTRTILQDVAAKGSVAGEHALNFGVPMRFEPMESGMKGRSLGHLSSTLETNAMNRGQITCWFVAGTDIEDGKRAEQLQADLTHASRVSTMGEMVASIAHELAQPIQITTAHAKASLRWLQHDPPNVTEARKGTAKIIEAGALASEIINRLRSLYKKAPFQRGVSRDQ